MDRNLSLGIRLACLLAILGTVYWLLPTPHSASEEFAAQKRWLWLQTDHTRPANREVWIGWRDATGRTHERFMSWTEFERLFPVSEDGDR